MVGLVPLPGRQQLFVNHPMQVRELLVNLANDVKNKESDVVSIQLLFSLHLY